MPDLRPVDIVKSEEPWTVATLPDGTRFRVKLVMTGVTREHDADGRPAFAPDGKPALHGTFNWVIDIQAPASAMRPASAPKA